MPKKERDKSLKKRAGKIPGVREVHAAIEQLKVKDAVKEKLDPEQLPQTHSKKDARDGA